ncbi:MAG: efflux RND transporter permease subunit [Rhodospirillales bacterium]|nr:efflux RND transporter permease subunit [Rhodospirillales bacterium]
MLAIIDAALSRSRTVLATLALILLSGAVAYMDIPKEADPDINIPIIYVTVKHDGISPEDSERLIIRPLEQELRTIEGIKEMRSTGYEGGGNVLMEFDAGFDADKALSDVREKVDDAKTDLPDDSEDPEVHEVNFSLFPVLAVNLSGNVPDRVLYKLADDLKDAVEGVNSVLEAEIAGKRDEMVEAIVDPVKLDSYGLAPDSAANAVGGSNLLVAAGAQDTGKGRFSVKVPGLFESVLDIIKLPLKVEGDSVIRLGDVADVRRTFKDPKGFARVDGKNAVVLEVSKRTGENIIDTIAKVRAVVAEEQANWPESLNKAVTVGFSQDKSNNIRDMLRDLQNNILAAVLLVMIVMIGALGIRSASLVGIAIPGSFLSAMLVLQMMGFTINIVILFGLIFSVGMLVDGAIVVTEYADRKMSEGVDRRHAYSLAARRMAWPIIASTATTLAAFLPLVFWPGVVGEFMKYLPITLLITLSASLFMALIFVPTMGSIIGKAGAMDAKTMKAVAAGEEGNLDDIEGFTGRYIRILRKALHHPGKVLVGSVTVLFSVWFTYGAIGEGVEFFPEVEPELVKVQVRARGNLSIYEKDTLMREVENRVLGVKGFKSVYTRVGKEENSQEAEDIIGSITLELAHWQERRKAAEILAEIKDNTTDIKGIYIDLRKEENGPPVGKPVQVQLSSRFPELLTPVAEQVRTKMEAIKGLINIEDSRSLPGIDWEIVVDRAQAAKFGASIGTVGNMVQMTTGGYKIGTYRPDDSDDEIELRTRFPEKHRTIAELSNIHVNTDSGAVPISNFVKRVAKPKTGTIKRVDGRRVLTVKSDVEEGVQVDKLTKGLQEWIKTQNFDDRITVTFKGEDEEQEKAKAFLGKAFVVAMFIMGIILVTQFNSFYSAGLILFAVVMSTAGVFIGLMITGQAFGIVMNGVGVIALAGIVVNNNIVLIDTYDRLKESIESPLEAILRTGAQRMRPVLLTTTTTMLGLLPMMYGVNIDFVTRGVTVGAPSAQWWTQLSTSIVYGLGFATVLTLVVTPCALMARANVHAWRRRRHLALVEKELAHSGG